MTPLSGGLGDTSTEYTQCCALREHAGTHELLTKTHIPAVEREQAAQEHAARQDGAGRHERVLLQQLHVSWLAVRHVECWLRG